MKDIEIELLEDLLSADITDTEKEYIDYILKSKTELSMLPTERAFIDKFPETEVFLEKQDIISDNDIEFAIRELIRDRKAFEAGKQLMTLASQVSNKGLCEEDLEKLRDMIDSDNNIEISKSSYSFKEFHKQYEETKDKPTGLLTFVNEIDDMIGGMNYGTVNIIMAYVASFKSVWGVNIAYNNTYKMGYNVALISLEVPREMVQENILCRHSAENKFSKYPFICHSKIRNRSLSEEEEDFIFNHPWIKRMSTAKTKYIWGSNVGKYSGSIINGATINYDRIISEAQAEIEALTTELKDNYMEPLGIYVC